MASQPCPPRVQQWEAGPAHGQLCAQGVAVVFPTLGGEGWHASLLVLLCSCVVWSHFVQLFLSLTGGETGFCL